MANEKLKNKHHEKSTKKNKLKLTCEWKTYLRYEEIVIRSEEASLDQSKQKSIKEKRQEKE